MATPLHLSILPQTFAVCRLPSDDPIPDWTSIGPFTSITRTSDELSIVCMEDTVPSHEVKVERGWRLLKIAGPLDFGLVGVLASLLSPLADAGIAVFTLSTYDTDYVLVKQNDLPIALEALRRAGHQTTII
ncbi:MAG: ACT domain-containing protein [Chloroflexi bacterium]|nr:ACT domain-containing protein [Chloroflexota bacterium]